VKSCALRCAQKTILNNNLISIGNRMVGTVLALMIGRIIRNSVMLQI
jgi:hypothetical protein